MGTTLTDRTRTAHKEHRCDWCSTTIGRGDRYRDLRVADNGTVYRTKSHPSCDLLVLNYARDLGLYDDDWALIEWADVIEWADEDRRHRARPT